MVCGVSPLPLVRVLLARLSRWTPLALWCMLRCCVARPVELLHTLLLCRSDILPFVLHRPYSSCGAKQRALFVPIPWRVEYSYGVPSTSRLWRAGDADDARISRVASCDSLLGPSIPGSQFDFTRAKCENASVGHPNHEGAALFA